MFYRDSVLKLQFYNLNYFISIKYSLKVLIEKAQFYYTELPFVKGWNIKDEGLYGKLQSVLNLDSMGIGSFKIN